MFRLLKLMGLEDETIPFLGTRPIFRGQAVRFRRGYQEARLTDFGSFCWIQNLQKHPTIFSCFLESHIEFTYSCTKQTWNLIFLQPIPSWTTWKLRSFSFQSCFSAVAKLGSCCHVFIHFSKGPFVWGNWMWIWVCGSDVFSHSNGFFCSYLDVPGS